MAELTRIDLSISGLGIIFYSPFAVEHIRAGEDYLQRQFLEPMDIARHVNGCSLVGFGTGGPGDFQLVLRDDLDAAAAGSAQFSTELCLEVRDAVVCFRDLYDLIRWTPRCPPNQSVRMENGFYRVVAYTSYAPVGTVQPITLSFLPSSQKPALHYTGAPELCG